MVAVWDREIPGAIPDSSQKLAQPMVSPVAASLNGRVHRKTLEFHGTQIPEKPRMATTLGRTHMLWHWEEHTAGVGEHVRGPLRASSPEEQRW